MYSSIGTIGTNGITHIPLVSIGDLHLITGTRIIRLASGWAGRGGAFYSPTGTIGTNGKTFIPLIKNEEHTLYLECVWARTHLACVWARKL